MNLEKTGLPLYVSRKDGETVAAALITETMPFDIPGMPWCLRVKFGEIEKEANFVPPWVAQNQPEVGKYFVLRESEQAFCMDKTTFNDSYSVK